MTIGVVTKDWDNGSAVMADRGPRVGMPWLVRIRWAAVIGQLLVFLSAKFLLGIELTWGPFVLVSLLVIVSNFFLTYRSGRVWLESRTSQGLVLIADILLLTALLYSYGGHTNPFSMVYLVHVVLAALLLGAGWTWGISILCSLCYAFLFRWYVPLEALSMGHMHGTEHEFNLHLYGMLVGFVLIAFLVSGFLQRMRAEIDWREQELVRRRSNEEKLAAVTTLSASVAHELGTPLGAMMLIVEDIQAEMNSRSAEDSIVKDVEVLRSQLERCADALVRLGQNSGQLFGEMPQSFSVAGILDEVHAQFDGRHPLLISKSGELNVTLPKEGLRHIVTALIKNAIEASPASAPVAVTVSTTENLLRVSVADSGKGMSAEELEKVGEPFFTTKDSGRGMGLGLFITKLFAERLRGSFLVESVLSKGTTVNVELPLSVAWESAQ
ncbi:MAG: HAMP domain-containing histidine kinase [Deltaproteobacteria bacterium]|nr:HAMP domain-containing histidine kinase [Deltaproteobacteria bacterium]